mgnify:CR=1 FL=1
MMKEETMHIETRTEQGRLVAVVSCTQPLITDAQSALDLLLSVRFETDAGLLALDKRALPEDFFRLGTGLAGEVLQKFVNYHMKVAIFGDYSAYTSKPLRDFIRESNHGKDFFFVSTMEEAVQRLTDAE